MKEKLAMILAKVSSKDMSIFLCVGNCLELKKKKNTIFFELWMCGQPDSFMKTSC